VLALVTWALVLGYISFLSGLSRTVIWTLRMLAWLMLATAILTAP
jgi:hypothetical protein